MSAPACRRSAYAMRAEVPSLPLDLVQARTAGRSVPQGGCTQKTRVLIVDDHPLVRLGLHSLINKQPDMVACGESENVPDALAKMRQLHPDIATVDLDLGSESGLDLVRCLRALSSELRILVVSAHEERWAVDAAAAAGAHGYLPKHLAPQILIESIRRLMHGDEH